MLWLLVLLFVFPILGAWLHVNQRPWFVYVQWHRVAYTKWTMTTSPFVTRMKNDWD